MRHFAMRPVCLAAALMLLLFGPGACPAAVPHHAAFVEDGVHDARGPLGAGDIITVIARATAGYQCVFDIPGVIDNGYMREVAPGLYVGTHRVGPEDNAVQTRVEVLLKGVGDSVSRLLEPAVTIDGKQAGHGQGTPALSFAHFPYRPAGKMVAGDTLFILLHTVDDDLTHYSFNSTVRPDRKPDFRYGPDGTLVAWRKIQKEEPPGAFNMSVWYSPPKEKPSIVIGHVPWERATAGLPPAVMAAPREQAAAGASPPVTPESVSARALAPRAVAAARTSAEPPGTRRERSDTSDADFSSFASAPGGTEASDGVASGSAAHDSRAAFRGTTVPSPGPGAAGPAAPAAGAAAGVTASGLGGAAPVARVSPSQIPGGSAAAGPAPPPLREVHPIPTFAPRRPAVRHGHPAVRPPTRHGRWHPARRAPARHARSHGRPAHRAASRHGPLHGQPAHPAAVRHAGSPGPPSALPTARHPLAKATRIRPALHPAAPPPVRVAKRAAPTETGAEGEPGPSASPAVSAFAAESRTSAPGAAPSVSTGPAVPPVPGAAPSVSTGPAVPPVPLSPAPAGGSDPADLAITALIRSTHLVWPHFHYRLRISVRNRGGRPAAACRLRYALQPGPGAKGGVHAGTIDVPALGPGDSEGLVSGAIPYTLKGRFTVRVWLELPPGVPARPEHNVRTETCTF